MRDDETGAVWTPTPLPIREKDAYRARHGQGYTVFEHNSHAIEQELTVLVPVERGRRRSGEDLPAAPSQRLRAAAAADRCLLCRMGARIHARGSTARISVFHAMSRAGRCSPRNPGMAHFPGHFAFAASSPQAIFLFRRPRADSWDETDRVKSPAALGVASWTTARARRLIRRRRCRLTVTIQAGQSQDVIFLLGQAESMEEIRALVTRYGDAANVEAALAATRAWWDSRLGAIQVKTPVLSTDFLLNRWLLYQALSCRFWARSALLSIQRRLRIPRSVAGCDGVRICRARADSRAHSRLRARASSSKGTCSIGGMRKRAWACERAARTIWCGSPMWSRITLRSPATPRILEEEVPFLEGAELKDGEQERMFIPGGRPRRRRLCGSIACARSTAPGGWASTVCPCSAPAIGTMA